MSLQWWQVAILVLAAVVLLFCLSVYQWLKANPVLPIGYRQHEMSWQPRRPRLDLGMNYHQAFSVMAASAVQVLSYTSPTRQERDG
jgi:hypothetical protein